MSSLAIQRRAKYSGQGKTVNKGGFKVSGIKFDLNALNLMTRYVMTNNSNVRRSQLIKLRNIFEVMDMGEYQNQPQLMNRIEFIRKALFGRIEKNLHDPDILIRFVSGGIMEDDLEVDVTPLNGNEITWLNETIAGCMKFAFIHEDIDTGLELFNKFKTADYRSREEIVDQIEAFTTRLQNKFRKAKVESAHEEMFTLQAGSMEPMIRDIYEQTTNPSMTLISGMQGFNEMLGGGFGGSRAYMLFGLPGEGKSMTMLDLAYQVKLFNKQFKTKDPTKIPCVVLLTMENSVRETVERLFAIVTKGESMTDYTIDQVLSMLIEEGELYLNDDSPINIVIKYVPQMSVDTSYLYTITEDLEDEGYEVIFMIQDYIKKIRSTEHLDDLRIELGLILDEMKAFATIKDIPVLTASQLNRDAVKAIDDNRKKNGLDSVRLIGRNNIGESMLLLDNSDGVFMLTPEYTSTGKYLGIQRVKKRYQASDRDIIYQPFEPNSPALVLDVGREPAFKETMNEMVNVVHPPMYQQNPRKISNVFEFDNSLNDELDLLNRNTITPVIDRSTAVKVNEPELITPITFVRQEKEEIKQNGYYITPIRFLHGRNYTA